MHGLDAMGFNIGDKAESFTMTLNTDSSSGESGENMVDATVTKEKEYTEHTAEAEFVDGETREFTFDAMREGDGTIVLKNYTGYTPSGGVTRLTYRNGASVSGFKSEAFMTISLANLKTFETTNRETKTLEYEEETQIPESEV